MELLITIQTVIIIVLIFHNSRLKTEIDRLKNNDCGEV